jgi:hypothetical protein
MAVLGKTRKGERMERFLNGLPRGLRKVFEKPQPAMGVMVVASLSWP